MPDHSPLRIAGLFAGIGGIELGMHEAGHSTALLCELDDAARAVLEERFPNVETFRSDVREIRELGEIDLVAAGFPCQDLSQAGRTAGIRGTQSSLVGEVFRLLDTAPSEGPKWLLLENVPFMLRLERGQAMRYLTSELGRLGYRWAYRVVDARAFGLPQRRQRVILLASRTEDPRPVLFGEDAAEPDWPLEVDSVCGFYWTEGRTGLGWAVDAIPTLKGGSGLGIPSPPAMWFQGSSIPLRLPDIRDAERLQGFPPDWTKSATEAGGRGIRWKLVGNAVSTPVSAWLGARLNDAAAEWREDVEPTPVSRQWPLAAWGEGPDAHSVDITPWPRREPYSRLGGFLEFPTTPLSHRAASGFYRRTRESRLRFIEEFITGVEQHVDAMEPLAA